MRQEDLLIVHKLAKQIEDRGREIQSLVKKHETTDEKTFNWDLRKKAFVIQTNLDHLETIIKYYYIDDNLKW